MPIGSKKAITTRTITSLFTSLYTAFFGTLMKQEFLSAHFFINWLTLVLRIYLLLLPFVLITGPAIEILVDRIYRKNPKDKNYRNE